MEIEFLRDLIIVIAGIAVILLAGFMAMMTFLIYRRISGVLKSADVTAARIKDIAIVTTDEIGKPLMQAAGFVQGIASVFHAINNIFTKGGRNNV